ncbi:hypothetical protein KPH14_004153 [Odynerus spinipes]|uniref:Uncharacterized protein n=1 Tax=Odynerus spinipes TaxID=1348599 RepID=A0AAD9VVW7_9HYME|nr:hypothetical protein KPH14_004153 [Odynerus spinipes]
MELPKLYTLDTFGLRSNTRELDTKYGEPRYAEIEGGNPLTIASQEIRWSSVKKAAEDDSNRSSGDRPFNDDYFPEGHDYEDDFNVDKTQRRSSKSPREDDADRFVPELLLSDLRTMEAGFARSLNFGILTDQENAFMSKNISDKTFEKLQTLVGKASKLKRKVFRVRHKRSVNETDIKDNHANDFQIDKTGMDSDECNNKNNNRRVVPMF